MPSVSPAARRTGSATAHSWMVASRRASSPARLACCRLPYVPLQHQYVHAPARCIGRIDGVLGRNGGVTADQHGTLGGFEQGHRRAQHVPGRQERQLRASRLARDRRQQRVGLSEARRPLALQQRVDQTWRRPQAGKSPSCSARSSPMRTASSSITASVRAVPLRPVLIVSPTVVMLNPAALVDSSGWY